MRTSRTIPSLLLTLLLLFSLNSFFLSPSSPPPSLSLPHHHHHPHTLHLNQEQEQEQEQPPPTTSSPAATLILLLPTPLSRHFSSRAATFFSSAPCSSRFLMTWISPLPSFRNRELLSIHSLFRSHPDACLLIASPSLDSPLGRRLLSPFTSLGLCVTALSPDYPSLFHNTPARTWFHSLLNGTIRPGDVPLGQNLSNLLRLALLYCFGGAYIDTDIILIKPISSLRNAIGAQAEDPRSGNWTRLNNAVMVFDKGHPLLYEFMEEFARSFDGSRWGHNGPYLVSRVVERAVEEGRGLGFRVMPRKAFYPVDWNGVKGLFKSGGRGVEGKVRWLRAESYAVHLWNRQSGRLKVEEGSVIGRIMGDCCLFCGLSSNRSKLISSVVDFVNNNGTM